MKNRAKITELYTKDGVSVAIGNFGKSRAFIARSEGIEVIVIDSKSPKEERPAVDFLIQQLRTEQLQPIVLDEESEPPYVIEGLIYKRVETTN